MDTLRWFGADWWGPPCNDGERVETPVGTTCCYCQEPVDAEDFGLFVLAAQGPDGAPPPSEAFTDRPMHAECWIRAMYGSVRHQRGECRGDGSCNTLAAGMTVREDATLAATYFMQRIDRYDQARAKGIN